MIYNAAGQITEMKYWNVNPDFPGHYEETRSYNALQQLTRVTVPGVLDQEYRFSDTQNNGRITQRKDWVSGEEVSYQYDSLNRLISAATTGPEWGQSFSYDGFGNLLSQTVTKGSAPTLSVNVNPATNRITTGGYGYDANGNLTSMPMLTMSYDIENRLVEATDSMNGTDRYVYDPANRRVFKKEASCEGCPMLGRVYFYGVEGNLLETYDGGNDNGYNVYFGRKLIAAEGAPAWGGMSVGPVEEDRLGSVVKHFPYGEEPTTTAQDRVKFATYYRDATTALDYAQNRYYARTIGRFTTTDPYLASGGPADPQSWNRYAYVEGDPINFNDPSGLFKRDPCPNGDCAPPGPGPGPNIGLCYPYSGGIWLCPGGIIMVGQDNACIFGLCRTDMPIPASGGGDSQPSLLRVTGYSTNSPRAIAVQNDLRLLRAVLPNDPDCDGWLKNNALVVDQVLGNVPGVDARVGVGSFSDQSTNAVFGNAATDLPLLTAGITINVAGAYFNSSASTGVTGIAGGTSEAKIFILLHELAHGTSAEGFREGDASQVIQNANNALVMQHCNRTVDFFRGW